MPAARRSPTTAPSQPARRRDAARLVTHGDVEPTSRPALIEAHAVAEGTDATQDRKSTRLNSSHRL